MRSFKGEMHLSEEHLIEYAKPYLKVKGFKLKYKRWIKETPDFTISFLIQGSSFSRENYYIRPGVFINALLPTNHYYGHFLLEITPSTPEEIMRIFEEWCEKWTNKPLIKERLLSFIEWEKRNPLEKRRAGLVNYEIDPAPAQEFFSIDLSVKQYILDNF